MSMSASPSAGTAALAASVRDSGASRVVMRAALECGNAFWTAGLKHITWHAFGLAGCPRCVNPKAAHRRKQPAPREIACQVGTQGAPWRENPIGSWRILAKVPNARTGWVSVCGELTARLPLGVDGRSADSSERGFGAILMRWIDTPRGTLA